MGAYVNSSGSCCEYGFLYSGGIYTTLAPPMGIDTEALGINNRGQIVGTYRNISNPYIPLGFLYSDGTYTTLTDPAADGGFTIANSINDSGRVGRLKSAAAVTSTVSSTVGALMGPRLSSSYGYAGQRHQRSGATPRLL